jgi:serine/threonine-protein kinase
VQRGLAGYRLLRRLSAGGQGEVYLAVDERLRRRVVIKLFHLEEQLSSRQRAVSEARVLARVEGARLARIHDVVSAGRRLALVMSYIPGCDLAALLAAHGRLPVELAVGITIDIAAGLAAAQRHQLVHGDLKAANVLIDPRGRATLVDFGIASAAGRRAMAGSREAATPEHLRRQPLSQHSDFFALGLLLYRMLFASHPFFHDGALDQPGLCAGLRDLPEIDGVAGPARELLRNLLCAMLAARPSERPADARVLRTALRELRAQLPAQRRLSLDFTALSRDESPQHDLPALPANLVRLPRRQRWTASAAALWERSTDGARLFMVGGAVLLLLLCALLVTLPGPCVAVQPVVISIERGTAALLPSSTVLERRVMTFLRDYQPRLRLLGSLPGSDSLAILQPQGLRDICVPTRQLGLELRCDDGSCRLMLTTTSALAEQRSELRLPADAGLLALQQAIDQLLDSHLSQFGL